MKKIILMAICAIMGISTYAQNLTWEGQVGLNVSSFNVDGYDSRIGFNVGARAQLGLPSIAEGVYANAGAFLTLKGASLDWGDLGSGKSNAYYVEVPIHIGYKYSLNNDFAIFGEFGPYFAYGLFGKTDASTLDFDEDYNAISVSESHDTFDEFKRFDFGLGFRIGAEFKNKYILSVGYDFGLVNTWKSTYWDEDDEYGDGIDAIGSVKNRNLTISLAYRF